MPSTMETLGPLLGLLVSLSVILLGSELFTNGVEWAGKRLKLAEGAVGSLLAAVGTALPETLVPIVAIFFSTAHAGMDVGVGAIAGAPFMLATLAFFVMGGIVLVSSRRGRRSPRIQADPAVIGQDLRFFMGLYLLAVLVTFTPSTAVRLGVAAVLVLGYAYYAYLHLREEGGDAHDPHPLHLSRLLPVRPRLRFIGSQILGGLLLIVGGAHFFVTYVTVLAQQWDVSPLVLSLLITPVATELPEKANSALWLLRGKDTLALGNVTGAMVFQSSVPVAIGVVFTPWDLKGLTLISAVLALGASAVFYAVLRRRHRVHPAVFLLGGLFYGVFLGAVLWKALEG